MRVTSSSFPDTLKYQLDTLATKQARLQTQAATGQRFKIPSDDPRATRKVLELQQEAKRLAQYNDNIETYSETLNSIYSAIQALKKVSDRSGEIAAMVDDIKSTDQLAAYRQEINQLLEQAVQISNTKNQYGFIFSGTKSDIASYNVERNEAGDIAAVNYRGNTKSPEVEIAPSTAITVHIPGTNKTTTGTSGLFETVNGSIFENLIALRDGLEGGTREDVKNIRDNVVPNLMLDESAIIHHISRIGSLEARLETAKTMGSRRMDVTEEFISREVDADMAQTLVKLNEVQAAYLAALKSGATIMNQSLLDYV